MKKKIGAVLDENLIKLMRQIAVTQNLTINQIFEEALKRYIELLKEDDKKTSDIAIQTKGVMKTSPELLKAVMEEGKYYDA